MRISGIATISAIILAASPAAAVDSCMTGRWRVDMDDLANILAAQLEGQAQPASGTVTMLIDTTGGIAIRVNQLVVQVAIPDVPAMVVIVEGFSGGGIQTEGNAWRMTISDYSLNGSAEVLGQRLKIPFSSATGLFGGGIGTYGCSGDTLSFESVGESPRIPRRWFRIVD